MFYASSLGRRAYLLIAVLLFLVIASYTIYSHADDAVLSAVSAKLNHHFTPVVSTPVGEIAYGETETGYGGSEYADGGYGKPENSEVEEHSKPGYTDLEYGKPDSIQSSNDDYESPPPISSSSQSSSSSSSSGEEIPNIVHYVWLSLDPSAPLKLKFKQFLSVYSSYVYLQPTVIYFHTNAAPTSISAARTHGDFWTRKLLSIPRLETRQVVAPTHSNKGDDLHELEWRSDFLRPGILHEFGGVYFDFDATPIRDLTPLRRGGFRNVFGWAELDEMNTGIMMAVKGSKFMGIMDREQHVVFDAQWSTASTGLLTKMALKLSAIEGEVLVLDRLYLSPAGWTPGYHADLFRSYNTTGSSVHAAGLLDVEEYWSGEGRGAQSWEFDYSRSYVIHAMSPGFAGRTPECRNISFGYIMERMSNFGWQMYPALRHAIEAGLIPEDEQEHV